MSPSHIRIVHMLRRGRHAEAEAAARELLAADMEDAPAWTFLGRSLMGLGKYSAAEDAARKAVSAGPENDAGHYLLAEVLLERSRPKEALAAARESVRQDPDDSTNHALVARVLNQLSRYQEAADAAADGLRRDPDCDFCRLHLSQAQSMLGRHGEADAVTRELLSEDPEDASNHIVRGHYLLLAGDPAGARQHFLEALRLEPDASAAREGLAQSLTNRNPVFRWILRFSVFCERLGWKAMAAGIAGVFLLGKLPGLTQGIPGAAAATSVLLALSVLFALLILCHAPLASLMLLAHRETRTAVSREERKAALWCVPLLLLSFWNLGAWLHSGAATGVLMRWPNGVFVWALLTSMVTQTYEAQNPWARRRMAWLSVFCAASLVASSVVGVVTARRFLKTITRISQVEPKPSSEELKKHISAALTPVVRVAHNLLLLQLAVMTLCFFADNIRAALENRAPDPD